MKTSSPARPIILAGLTLGVGMGGFVDGILFHQILQLHNMLSNRVVRDTLLNEQINMFWDGLFHAFTWICVAAGLWMLWRAVTSARPFLSGSALFGSMVAGWGLFNLVEGLIDHEILQLHHVFQNGNHLLWDMVFLGAGLLLLLIGTVTVRHTVRSTRGVNCG